MKKKTILICMGLLFLVGCKEHIDMSARYVNTERTIAIPSGTGLPAKIFWLFSVIRESRLEPLADVG